MSPSKFLIVSNGKLNNLSVLKRRVNEATNIDLHSDDFYVIACDGATTNLELLGLEANLLVGDFDSISETKLQEYKTKSKTEVLLDPDQSKTDTRIAIELALSKGAKEVIIITATGGRLDHLLANILDLKFIPKEVSVKLVDEFSIVEYIQESKKFKGNIGDTLSLIPLSPILGLSLSGLKYPLDSIDIQSGEALICNKFIEKEATIDLKSGEILVIRAYD